MNWVNLILQSIIFIIQWNSEITKNQSNAIIEIKVE